MIRLSSRPPSKQPRLALAVVVLTVAAAASGARAQGPRSGPDVPFSTLDAEIRTFLCTELASHTSQVTSVTALPDRVHGALTTGEFTWGTYLRALATGAAMCGTREVAGRDVADLVARIGLHEARAGGAAFTQLYAAQAIRQFGAVLDANPVWQRLPEAERREWRPLLDPGRFYDPVKQELIGRPENYLGVAARITAISHELGLIDRRFLDSVLDRSAIQFTRGALYADDAPPTGRYDRYSNEYARYIWEAATRAGRTDLLDALRPSMKKQMRLWWDLVLPDGYGYQWGRSLGVVSYLDTLEIVAFVAAYPEFRPAPLPDLVSAYLAAWRWLRRDYPDDKHMLSVFAFGRGNYGYITKEREWQQTVGFFGKLAAAHTQLTQALAQEPVAAIPAVPRLADVARFEFFAEKSARPAGVWVVRTRDLAFALPITTGTLPGAADYLPAPHGLRGFAPPVEQVLPAAAPFLTLADGRTVVAGDGADRILPDPSGKGVTASWTQWSLIGGKPAERADVGLTATVTWRLEGGTLTREDVIAAARPVQIRLLRLAVPSTADRLSTTATGGAQLEGSEGTLTVSASLAGREARPRVHAGGDGPLGRGARGPLPLRLEYEWTNVEVTPAGALRLRLLLAVAPQAAIP